MLQTVSVIPRFCFRQSLLHQIRCQGIAFGCAMILYLQMHQSPCFLQNLCKGGIFLIKPRIHILPVIGFQSCIAGFRQRLPAIILIQRAAVAFQVDGSACILRSHNQLRCTGVIPICRLSQIHLSLIFPGMG